MSQSDDKNALVYLLAGFGLGALIGGAAGLLFAPKQGTELRGDLGSKFKELKGRTDEWVAERRAKHAALEANIDEAGA